jgi:hypothetical protein
LSLHFPNNLNLTYTGLPTTKQTLSLHAFLEEEVTRHWKKLQTEELHYSNSSIIIRVIKPRRNKWARHVACMNIGREMSIGFFLWRNLLERAHL